MVVEIVELTEFGMPGETRTCDVLAVPRIGELLAFGDEFFEVVNVIHQVGQDKQIVNLFVRTTKAPYQEPKSRFGFGAR